MTKREKYLGVSLLVVLVIITHILAGAYLKKQRVDQEAQLAELQTRLNTYSMMDSSAELIKKEVTWVNQHTPKAMSFQNAQTDLQNFLISSSKNLGFSPFVRSMNTEEDAEKSGEIYNRVQIQMSARATEKQIYQWLVGIHQPEKMRILSYLKLSPPANESDLINCQIIAEQYIIAE